jgi:hypothetical protein
MRTQKLTADDALALAQEFHDLAVALGDYRFANWDDLTSAQRSKLEDAQWSLLNASSDAVTMAVGIALDSSQVSLAKIRQATAKAQSTVKSIKTVKKVINIATAAVALAAAVASKDPGAIVKNAQGLLSAVDADV